MTKDDLKTLAQLPKVLAVLRKLAGEAAEVEKVLAKLTPKPIVLSSAPAARLHDVQAAVAEGKMTNKEAIAALEPSIPHAIVNAYDPGEEDEPKPVNKLAEAKAERMAALELMRKDPVRQALMAQFQHDGGSENGAPSRSEPLLNLSGD